MRIDNKRRRVVWFYHHIPLLFVIVAVLFLANALFTLLYFGKWNSGGEFGDQFGAVNALFSGLAFAGLIITILLQRRDLRLQRKDLKMQRKELQVTNKQLEGQKEQLEEQNKTLKVQRFENTFFKMLSQFQEIVSSISYTYVDYKKDYATVTGREAFYESFEVAPHKCDIPDWNPVHLNNEYKGMRELIRGHGLDGYMDSFTPSYFDHYFRFLYRILKFVQTSPLVTEFNEEYEYTSMLRAMLSRYELVWLYYNGLSNYGNEKLKPLIERYAMLKNLRGDLLADKIGEFGTYKPSAWQKIAPSSFE